MQPFITQVKGEALHLDMVITRQEFGIHDQAI